MLNSLIYADDIVIFAPSVKGLQKMVDICYKYGNSNNIIFNENKTVFMHLKSKSHKWLGKPPVILLGETPINTAYKVTYLGHIICDDLSDDEDMLKTVRSLYCKANTLIRKFSSCTETIPIYLFKMYCANLYCSSLWCNFKQSTKNKLIVAYNNAFRILIRQPRFCSASNMFVQRNVYNFNALWRKSIFSLRTRIASDTNVFISTIINCDIRLVSQLFLLHDKYLFSTSIGCS